MNDAPNLPESTLQKHPLVIIFGKIVKRDESNLLRRQQRFSKAPHLRDWYRLAAYLLDPKKNNSITTSTLSIVETLSALNRRVREATIHIADYPQIVGDFLAVSNNEYRFVNTSRSARASRSHPRRTNRWRHCPHRSTDPGN